MMATSSSRSPKRRSWRYVYLYRTLAPPDGAPLQSILLVIDAVVKDKERMVGLAKPLTTSFLIRGAQLAVVRRLDSQYHVRRLLPLA